MALIKVDSVAIVSRIVEAITVAVSESLPEYARPVFLRFTEGGVDVTDTFKYRKRDFAAEGFDPTQRFYDDDKFFVRTKAAKSSGGSIGKQIYFEMTDTVYHGILEGTTRLA
jgi:hypothetical protein